MGNNPPAGMILDKLGNLYSTTNKGGLYGHGTYQRDRERRLVPIP